MKRIATCGLVFLLFVGGAARAEDQDAEIDRLFEELGQPSVKALDALNALVKIGDPVVPKARALLRDDATPATLRWRSAQVLGFVKARAAVDDLLVHVTDEAGLPLGPVAVVAIRNIGDPATLPGLRAALAQAKRPQLRRTIERCIAELEGGPTKEPAVDRPFKEPVVDRPFKGPGRPPGPMSPPWVYFLSRETARGPRLEIEDGAGEITKLETVADAVLISYLASGHFGGHPRLSIDEADWNRVLLRFDVPADLQVEHAHLVVEQARGAIRVDEPIHAALHRVTQAWAEDDVTWDDAPSFEEKPALRFDLAPAGGTVRIDVTPLFAPRRAEGEHGWLIHVAEPGDYRRTPPGPVGPPTGGGSGGRTGARTLTDDLLELVTWAPTPEAACERATKEGKLVLALLRATHDPRAATTLEEIFLACVLADPSVAEIVRQSFVPVRVAVPGWTYPLGKVSGSDPFAPFGISAADVKPLALVVATGEGKVLGRVEGMGTFAPELTTGLLVGTLADADLPPASTDPMALLAAGRHVIVQDVAAGMDDRTQSWLGALGALRRGDFRGANALAGGLLDGPDPRAPYRNEALAVLELAALREGRPVPAAVAQEKGALESAFADEIHYWRGVAALRGAWHEAAKPHWDAIHPSSPWQLKRRAWMRWPARMFTYETPRCPDAAPRRGTTERTFPDAKTALDAGLDALLSLQRPDGSWPNATRQLETLAPITALGARALLALRPKVDAKRRVRLERALERAHAWLEAYLEETDSATANSFGQAYLLDYALDRFAADEKERPFADEAVSFCAGGQLASGAWSYNKRWGETWRGGFGGWPVTDKGRTHSMNTGPCLVALARAKRLGLDVEAAVLAKGKEALLAMRDEPGVFTYTWPEPRNFNKADTSIGRAPVCEHALFLLGATPQKDVTTALETFMQYRGDLRKVAKVTSGWVPPRAVSSYFQLFAWHHAMRALHVVDDPRATAWRRELQRDLLAMAEVDGTWLDFEDMGKAYGTAVALLVLTDVE